MVLSRQNLLAASEPFERRKLPRELSGEEVRFNPPFFLCDPLGGSGTILFMGHDRVLLLNVLMTNQVPVVQVQ